LNPSEKSRETIKIRCDIHSMLIDSPSIEFDRNENGI